MDSMPTGTVIRCAVDDTLRFTADILRAIGMPTIDAEFMASVILSSHLAGHESHGLRRLPEYVATWKTGVINPRPSVTLDLDRGTTVRVNGDNGFGHVIVRDATDVAVDRAQQFGIAAVAVRGCSHAGRYADFCQRAAELGVATLFFVNDAGAGQDVAPPGGIAPRLATNPLAVGIPRSTAPHLVVDMSTSVVAAGRVAEWRDRGEDIPHGWLTSTGALRPAAGVKGFGLSLVVEALAGALTEAGTVSSQPHDNRQGVFIIAVDITRLRPLTDFTSAVDEFLTYVRDVPLEPGADAVRIPGEGGVTNTVQRSRRGLPVQPFTWKSIEALAHEFGIDTPRLTPT